MSKVLVQLQEPLRRRDPGEGWALWVLTFALYLWRYGPILQRPRVDGLSG